MASGGEPKQNSLFTWCFSDRFIFSNCICTVKLGLFSRLQWKLTSLKVNIQQSRLKQILQTGLVIHFTMSQKEVFSLCFSSTSLGKSPDRLNLWFSFNSVTCSYFFKALFSSVEIPEIAFGLKPWFPESQCEPPFPVNLKGMPPTLSRAAWRLFLSLSVLLHAKSCFPSSSSGGHRAKVRPLPRSGSLLWEMWSCWNTSSGGPEKWSKRSPPLWGLGLFSLEKTLGIADIQPAVRYSMDKHPDRKEGSPPRNPSPLVRRRAGSAPTTNPQNIC